MILSPLSYAADELLVKLVVNGKYASGSWQSPVYTFPEKGTKVKGLYFANLPLRNSWENIIDVGIVNNCEVAYYADGDKSARKLNVSLNGATDSKEYIFSEPVFITHYSISCRIFIENRENEDVDFKDLLIGMAAIFDDGMEDAFYAADVDLRLGTTYSCTLSIPDPIVNFSGSAQSFQAGLKKKVKIDSDCAGVPKVAVFLNGTGVPDSEGCLSVENTTDRDQSLRMCAAGFSFDGSKGKQFTLDNEGKSSDEIEFTLSSHDHQLPALGEYKGVVHAVISPS
ncbi:hypothetical protein [Erwinia sp. E602]|uniref:hypothetical protein n=1 Tax=Erwinia sp. E602 TaxID=2675378 RepID=UPI001BAC0032|nr:hypothetical protein [Erwinia sp. E602]